MSLVSLPSVELLLWVGPDAAGPVSRATAGEALKEGSSMDLNHVTLTGTLERHPITRFTDGGTPQVSLTLRVDEPGPAGQLFTLFVPCEAYGQAGEHAGELTAGVVLLVAGKLASR